MTETQTAFIQAAAERYDAGAAKAQHDIERLAYITVQIAAFVDIVQADFDRLDMARDVKAGDRVTRSRFLPDCVASVIAEALSNELLSDEAAAVLAEMVKKEAG